MDFLNRAAAIWSKSATAFPFNFDPKNAKNIDRDSLWSLCDGTKREDGSNVTVFTFDVHAHRSLLPLARNAVKKLRTLRHPGIIKFIESYETDTLILVATERVMPLSWDVKRNTLNADILRWGLYTICKTVQFLNDSASSVHGNLRLSSIYTSESGEWRLSGLEVLTNLKEDETAIFTYGSLLAESGRYASPEIVKGSWNVIKSNPLSATDSWNLATLIYETFNGPFTNSEQLNNKGKIPQDMYTSYKRLLNPNPKSRLSVSQFLELGSRAGGFFSTDLIRVSQSLENISIQSEHERETLLEQLDGSIQKYPPGFLHYKILPEMLKAFEFGGGGQKVFSIILSIVEKLSDDEFERDVQPVIIRMFGSQERGVRMCLLENLGKLIEKIPPKLVNDKIFPNMMTGFLDTVPVIREQTVRAVLLVIPKLNERNINGDLLKYLAKSQADEQPGIRTNTTICLGKIAKHLNPTTRKKVLVSAFVRSLRDPFVHARNAGLMALSATSEFFDANECATKIIPATSALLIDKEKIVRVQASKTMDTFLSRISKLTASMPDTALAPPPDGSRTATPTPSSTDFAMQAGSAIAGWAMSGIKSRVIGIGETPAPVARPDSAPAMTTVSREMPVELRGLGSKGDLDEFEDDTWSNGRVKSDTSVRKAASTTSNSTVNSAGFGAVGNVRSGAAGGMKLGGGANKKKSVAEQVVEEEELRKSIDEGAAAWGALDDWNDDEQLQDDGWGFDD